VSSGITPGETGDASSSLKIRHPLAKWIRSDSTIGLGIGENMHSIPTSRVTLPERISLQKCSRQAKFPFKGRERQDNQDESRKG
jgi:hypothetical protein